VSALEGALWGILQGLTEFLPVSSSGHLVLVPWLLGLDAPGMSLDVLLHLATLLALVIYFRREVLMLIRGVVHLVARRRADTADARLAWLVIVSSIPAVIVALVLETTIEQAFAAPMAAAVCLLVTGTILYLAERRGGDRAIADLGSRDAGLIGLAQAVALVPGISRSGATMAAGRALGLERSEAARYAFVMSIPVVFGAAMLELAGMITEGYAGPVAPLAVGMLAAFLSGYLAVAVLIRYVQGHSLRVFSYYCWSLGMLAILVWLVRAW